MKKIAEYSVLAGLVLSLAACSGPRGDAVMSTGSMNADSQAAAMAAASGSLQGQGLGDAKRITGADRVSEQDLLQVTNYYFAFNSDVVEAQYRDAMIARAHYLADHPNDHIVLAGNTDSRGSREYNIALGWRRAQSVEKVLLLNGANESQIKLVSYGEEKPAVQGDTEAAYAKNRRVAVINEA